MLLVVDCNWSWKTYLPSYCLTVMSQMDCDKLINTYVILLPIVNDKQIFDHLQMRFIDPCEGLMPDTLFVIVIVNVKCKKDEPARKVANGKLFGRKEESISC